MAGKDADDVRKAATGDGASTVAAVAPRNGGLPLLRAAGQGRGRAGVGGGAYAGDGSPSGVPVAGVRGDGAEESTVDSVPAAAAGGMLEPGWWFGW
jgi:hypothetical protein